MEETNTTVTVAKRPTFITVLCILSFIGIGLSLIWGIKNYFEYSAAAAQPDLLSSFGQADGTDPLGQAMMDAIGDAFKIDYAKLAMNELITTLLNIPILIGVLMMWKQKKVGFYVYAAFEIIQPIIPLVLGLGLVGGVMSVLGLIVAIVFIVLYAVNLKHMS